MSLVGGGGVLELDAYMFQVRDSEGEGRCVHMMRYGACCCDCMSVFVVMHVCGCVPGVQLGGRCCCWHEQWVYFVRVTGSVVGFAVFWVGVLHIIFKELVLLYYVPYRLRTTSGISLVGATASSQQGRQRNSSHGT